MCVRVCVQDFLGALILCNRNWHGLFEYFGSINACFKSSNVGQHRTK